MAGSVARFGGKIRGGKIRKAASGGIAAIGACVLLSACSPTSLFSSTQFGAAAMVGGQHISQLDLSSQVSSIQASAAKAKVKVLEQQQTTLAQQVLSNLIQFKIADAEARSAGVSVTYGQQEAGVKQLESEIKQAAQQNAQAGFTSAEQFQLSYGISDQMVPAYARMLVEQNMVEAKLAGGKPPKTQAEAKTLLDSVNKASCSAAKSLNITVNPQFGRLDYAVSQQTGLGGFGIGTMPSLLSASGGSKPSPAPTSTALSC